MPTHPRAAFFFGPVEDEMSVLINLSDKQRREDRHVEEFTRKHMDWSPMDVAKRKGIEPNTVDRILSEKLFDPVRKGER
jgi:hypothetical protein